MLSKSLFSFLEDLRKNNNRDWFQENKPRYLAARDEFIECIRQLTERVAAFDPEIMSVDPKKSVFRIYRDIRFSKDKRPYKTNMGAHLVAPGLKPHERAGYYIHIEPDNCFLAGGAYMPSGPWLKAIRQEIDYNAAEFKKILNSKEFKKYFGKMEGEKLKTSPRDYPADHPEIELLRHKSFLAVHNLSDDQVTSKAFLNHCTKVFKALQPFDRFLNRALD